MNGLERLASSLQPYALSLLRIAVALAFLEHPLAKFFGFPHVAAFDNLQPYSLPWTAGVIELIGGTLLLLGLFSRPVAFILAGEMAFAYFISHAPRNFFPILNNGLPAFLYCFTFFYLAFAGPGPLSLDRLRKRG